MGIFDRLFGSKEEGESKEKRVVSEKEEGKNVPWKELTQADTLTEIQRLSSSKTQVIFKHSTRCGISRMVLRSFEDSFDLTESQVDLYYLDLLNYRGISSEIAEKFNVFHESPQVIVLRNEAVVYHASHGEITSEVLHQFV